MTIFDNHQTRRPGTRRSLLAAALAALLTIAACGGSDSADSQPTATGVESSDSESSDEGTVGEPTAQDGASIVLRPVELPEGMLFSGSANQAASLGNVGFVVALRPEGTRLISIRDSGISDTSALIPGARVSEVFKSGSRIVMTGYDGGGDLVVLSSHDGETFVESRVAVPVRFVEPDVWTGTSVYTNVVDVADLGDDLYLVVRMGITWERANDMVVDYAYSISEEVGETAKYAGTIRQLPQDDGDTLFNFVKDGEIVFEALASEAGIEPGYLQAFKDAKDEEKDTYSSWFVSADSATEAPPMVDGLIGHGFGLAALYPVEDGVAAIVTNFNPEAAASNRYASLGSGALGTGVALRFSTEFEYSVHHTTDGKTWEQTAEKVGEAGPKAPSVLTDLRGGLFGLLYGTGEDRHLQLSEDGLEWKGTPWRLPDNAPGGRVSAALVDGHLVMVGQNEDGSPDAAEFVAEEGNAELVQGESTVTVGDRPIQTEESWTLFSMTDAETRAMGGGMSSRQLRFWRNTVHVRDTEDAGASFAFLGDLLIGIPIP